MLAMFNGKPIFGPRGLAGPDGNPIGTIISYMGVSAPTDYLICDGTSYNISDYPKLAEFFEAQFGSSKYFGGDGVTTFAVPDMRNLFLRGFHGTSEEQLSGAIGARQEATQHQNVYGDGEPNSHFVYAPYITGDLTFTPQDADTAEKATSILYVPGHGISAAKSPHFYTSRPVNMAVLYCIKATEAETYEDAYSTEETRIGTWIDGKPIYRKCYPVNDFVMAANKDTLIEIGTYSSELFLNIHGAITLPENQQCLLPYAEDNLFSISVIAVNGKIYIVAKSSISTNRNMSRCYVILEYTKTTD